MAIDLAKTYLSFGDLLMAKPETTHSDYFHFCDIPTRWEDNDQYGHVNNIIYLSFFDTAVNTYLIGEHALNLLHGDIIGYVVETNCKYFSALTGTEISILKRLTVLLPSK